MKLKTILISLTLLLIPTVIHAQLSGNIVYGQSNNIEKKRSSDRLYLTDSTFVIEAGVLVNVIADSYVVTFGVSEEAATVKDCNEKMEKRIQGFVLELNKLGHSEADIYIDMTTQNRVLGYTTTGNVAQQYLKGFEIKKNVIIKLKTIKALDKIVISASNYQIYDLVKVDYIVTDITKVYNQLFQAATDIINQKKALYIGVTNAKLSPTAQIYGEQFYSYYPSQLYKTYNAYESSEVYNNNYSNFIKKDLRKEATFYYDKMNYSGFDKVINPTVTEPAVEFVLTLQIKYQIERSKK
jgi:uncharacterized protein YggE